MGREWYRSGRSSTKRGVGNGGERDSPSHGCMCAFLQLFDFHPFQFPLNQQHSPPPLQPDSLPPQQRTELKGVEAPRNSLESIEAAPLSSIFEEEGEEKGGLKIPMGIQIKTSGGGSIPKVEERASKAKTTTTENDLCSEASYSPGTKTPSLVARLMGIDLLPESSSPSLSSIHHRQPIRLKKSQLTHRGFLHDEAAGGTRSLPETPRMSSARRSDVDPRLSLQINRENASFSEELFSRCSVGRRELMTREDERSPSQYAKQIAKRIKDSVGRRVGTDITNTIRNRDNGAEKSPKNFANFPMEETKSRKKFKNKTAAACAAKDRALDAQYQSEAQSWLSPTSIDEQSRPRKSSSKPRPRPTENQPEKRQTERRRPIQRCEKDARERFESRLKKPPQTAEAIRNKKEDSFKVTRQCNGSERKCKRTPLSNELMGIPKTLAPVKREPQPAKTAPVQGLKLSDYLTKSCAFEVASGSESTNQKTHEKHSALEEKITPTAIANRRAEAHYITKILRRVGIGRDLHSGIGWLSPPHPPLNSSIFHDLERDIETITIIKLLGEVSLIHRCNRKLTFDLVNEILGTISRPSINLSKATSTIQPRAVDRNLVESLCARIRSFPSADCRVLEDIDALIDVDLARSQVTSSWEPPYDDDVEPRERIIAEIEEDIVDSLVRETAAFERPAVAGLR